MFFPEHSLPRIECTRSYSSRRNIWTSSRSSRTCSERWPAPKPPFGSGSCRHRRSGILKNSRCNSFRSRKASIRRYVHGTCRYKRVHIWKSSRHILSYSHTPEQCWDRRCGYGSCRSRPPCRPRNREKDNIRRSHIVLRQLRPDRRSRYIVRRSCPPIPNADKNSWRWYIDIPACRRSFRICRRRKRRYRSLWPNRQAERGRIRRKRTFRR